MPPQVPRATVRGFLFTHEPWWGYKIMAQGSNQRAICAEWFPESGNNMNKLKWPDDFIGKVIQGDCLEVMGQMPDKCVDLVLTDPPYGINRDKGFGGSVGFRGSGSSISRRNYDDVWDSNIPSKEVFSEIIRVSKNQILFGGNFFAHILPASTHWIFWDKIQTMPTFGDGELLWTSFTKKSIKKYIFQQNGLLSATNDGERFHPTQKPSELVGLIARDYTKGDAVILDCFLGSGTTAIACINSGRKWIGIEKEEKYCAIARKRIEAEQSQGKLF